MPWTVLGLGAAVIPPPQILMAAAFCFLEGVCFNSETPLTPSALASTLQLHPITGTGVEKGEIIREE